MVSISRHFLFPAITSWWGILFPRAGSQELLEHMKINRFYCIFFFTIIVDFFRVGKCNPVPFRWPTFFLHSCAVRLPTSCIQSIDLLHLSFILSSITTMTFCCPWTLSNWTTIFHSIEIEVKYSSCD
jgi:hypothetical protein